MYKQNTYNIQTYNIQHTKIIIMHFILNIFKCDINNYLRRMVFKHL